MNQNLALNAYSEMNKDAMAVSASNFCSLWPAGKIALQALAGLITNPFAKVALNTVIALGDGFCPTVAK